jgi:hypothetical protein
MIRSRPLQERVITLVKLEDIYYWTCSSCYWKSLMDSNPIVALEEFSAHQCEHFPIPTGHLVQVNQASEHQH